MDNCISVYVDCTETIKSNLNTGIQRTVRNIISRSEKLKAELNIDMYPVISIDGTFYKYNLTSNGYASKILSNIFATFRNTLDALFRYDGKLKPASDDHSTHSRIIENSRSIMPYLFKLANLIDRTLTLADIKNEDIIFYADAFWNVDTHKSFINYRKQNKIALVYDVIPISNPNMCDDINVFTFNKNIKSLIDNVQGMITISTSEMENIKTYLESVTTTDNLQIDFIHLGADFKRESYNSSQVRKSVINSMGSGNTFLMVGTIEPRKNYPFVLDAFERHWLSGGNGSLCIVGKYGWKSSGFIERIKSHQFLGKRLYYFADANDNELAYCYEHCKCVVFASVAEGFGLPLVEAMTYGQPVLVSDIPVFREIGGDYPVYFPLNDLETLEKHINGITHNVLEKRQPRTWMTWDESVINLFGKLLKMVDASKQGLKF